jgi:hypothetical protein
MNAAHWPADRSLDRRGGPDERARPPRELLDNLRLRLSRLADNHPSAAAYADRDGADLDGSADRAGQAQADDADAAPGPDATSVPGGSGHDGVFDDQKRNADAGMQPPAGSQTGAADGAGPADAVRTAATALASGLGALATMELPGRGRHAGDPYRPWFMAGEPGSPWWSGTLY